MAQLLTLCQYHHHVCRDLCISTGRKVAHKPVCDVTGAAAGGTASESNSSQLLHAQHQLPSVNWRRVYFQQSHALSFNGINDYVALPVGLLNLLTNDYSEWQQCAGRESLGFTIDLMVYAHQVPANPPQVPSASARTSILPPAGGMLFGCQDREFGRSRRAARLHTLPLLYVGTDGYLHSAIGPMRSSQMLADDQWHRVTLTIMFTDAVNRLGKACMYVDGVLDEIKYGLDFSNLPSYSVLGSGITEGCSYGVSTPVYNCHSFHGLIDELRLWARPLQPYEVSTSVCLTAAAVSILHVVLNSFICCCLDTIWLSLESDRANERMNRIAITNFNSKSLQRQNGICIHEFYQPEP